MKQRIVLLGPPASGKGTQAERLTAAFGIPHVSTGALLRAECAQGTALGQEADAWTRSGLMVPDELAIRIITSWIAEHGVKFLFDGFPRSVTQARYLGHALAEHQAPLDLIVLLEISEQKIRDRVLDRLSCLNCGSTFGAALHYLSENDPCPQCGKELVRRNDDTSEALEKRLIAYRELTLPVVEYYESLSPEIFYRINAEKNGEEIFASLSALVI